MAQPTRRHGPVPVGETLPDVTGLRLTADDLLTLLRRRPPRLLVATSRDDWWRTRLYGRTAAGPLRHHNRHLQKHQSRRQLAIQALAW